MVADFMHQEGIDLNVLREMLGVDTGHEIINIGGILFINGVTQQSVDMAISNYDHKKQSDDKRLNSISARLAQVDTESVRPLRAKAAGNATAADDSKLAALDAEAAALRVELKGMSS